MRSMLRILVVASLVAGFGWLATNVRVDGQTGFEHFQQTGGERAVREGWAWLTDRGRAALERLSGAGRAAAHSMLDTLGNWVSQAVRTASLSWDSLWSSEAVRRERPSQATEGSPRSVPDNKEGTSASLSSAPGEPPSVATTGRAALAQSAQQATSTLERPRTRVDHAIRHEDTQALNQKLSSRRP